MAVSDALGWGIWTPCLLEAALHTTPLKELVHVAHLPSRPFVFPGV